MPFDFKAIVGVVVDGRPLHRYRLADRRFDEIEIALRKRLGNPAGRETAALFVLWGAERYRRDFDGGAFSWSFLSDRLGRDLPQATLRALTDTGLAAFRRPPPRRSAGGTQYLKTLAAEGGIPVKLLGEEGGYRAALLGLVSDLERFGVGCPQQQALDFARRRAARLPMGYRTDEFHELFVEFAREIVDLRGRAPKDILADQVEGWLDREEPGWRETLTLRIDEKAARSLLAEAMVVRGSGELSSPLTRQLVRSREDWEAFVDVAPESMIPVEFLADVPKDLRRVRLVPRGALSTACPDLTLSLERDEREGGAWTCKRISGRRTESFALPLHCPLDMVAVADGRMLCDIQLPAGGSIEPCEGISLWTLAETGEDGGARRLEHAGGASLRSSDPHVWALVATGTGWHVTEGLVATDEGGSADAKLLRLEGSGRLSMRDWSVRIVTRAERTERDEILALGRRHPALRDASGEPIFQGMPDILFRKAGRGFRSLAPRRCHYCQAGSSGWSRTPPGPDYLGTLDVAAEDEEGGIGARTRIRLIPADAVVAVRGDRLSLSGFSGGVTLRLGDGDPVTVDRSGGATLPLTPDLQRRDRARFLVATPNGQNFAWQVSLATPSAAFADLEGELLAKDRRITRHDLRQWRIVPAGTGKTGLRLRLESPRTTGRTSPLVVEVSAEVPVSSFRRLVDDLLGYGGPEAELRLRLLSGPDQSPRLKVRRFLAESDMTPLGVLPTARDLDATRGLPRPALHAMNLDDPACITEVSNGTEEQIRSALGPGRWFLLPSVERRPMRPPRPIVVETDDPRGDEGTAVPDRFVSAGKAGTREDRIVAYAEILSGDVTEGEMRALESAIDSMAQLEASPASLDQLLALEKTPTVAVRLLFRGDASSLSDRLDLENHGTGRWFFASPEAWGAGMSAEHASMAALLRATPQLAAKAETHANEVITRRVREILLIRPELDGHLALGLMRSGLGSFADLHRWLGRIPPAFNAPEAVLLDGANDAVARNGDSDIGRTDLRAQRKPQAFDRFADELFGMIEAPLVISEVAFGLRPAPRGRAGVELIQFLHLDPGYFERALPAAMAWQEMQRGH